VVYLLLALFSWLDHRSHQRLGARPLGYDRHDLHEISTDEIGTVEAGTIEGPTGGASTGEAGTVEEIRDTEGPGGR
jgi:hypothetical protein